MAEKKGIDPEPLTEALLHYARSERQFRAAGWPIPPQIVARRAALARILSDDVVIGVFKKLMTEPPSESGPGSGGPAAGLASLAEIGTWLSDVQASAKDRDSLTVLIALVEEALGDESAAKDPDQAAKHYRKALQLIASTPVTLSVEGGITGRIADVEGLRDKLHAVDAADADAESAAVILQIVDAEFSEPITHEGDLRSAVRQAFEHLAAADAQHFDFDRLKNLRLAFLDYDWESRYQSISQTTAVAFLNELVAAEGFLTAELEHADQSEKARWLAARGRIRFWLSTLGDEDLPGHDPADFDHWLDASIADFEAIGNREELSPWDAIVLGSAYSRAIERAPDGTDTASTLEKAADAFEQAIHDPKFDDFGEYRRRLAFDGYVLALERSLLRIRRDPFLAGFGPQPGDPDYDRDRLANLAFDAFSLARRREEVRAEADSLGLLGKDSGWSLDTLGDYYWGFTAAQAGALLRIESGANGPPTECDRLAAHPHDVDRSTRPVDFSSVDVDQVLAACRGDTPRDMFNRARALSKMSDPDEPAILNLLIPAAKAGLPIAYNNLSIMIGSLNPDFVSPAELQTTFSSLSLVDAYPGLSDLLRPRTSDDERRNTFKWLASKAAALDVPEAHRDLAELASDDPLTRGLHLVVAEKLFAEAGRNAEADAASADLAALNLSSKDIKDVQAAAENREHTDLVLIDESLAAQILSLW